MKLNPGDAVALADRGSVYRRKGKADLALADFNAALKINPSLQQALNGRRLVDGPNAGAAPSGLSAQGATAGQFPPLARNFGGAPTGKTYLPGWLQPTTAKAFLDRGTVSAMGQENDKAIADFNEAIRLDPNMASAYVARGQALAAKGDVALALRDFDSALRLSPNDPATLKIRCFHRAKAGQGLDLALADCDAAVKLAPAQPDMLEGRALVLFRQGQYQGAVADCEAAIRLNPRQAGCLYIRGAARGRLNDAVQSTADIAAARAISLMIVGTYAKMGVSPRGAALAAAAP